MLLTKKQHNQLQTTTVKLIKRKKLQPPGIEPGSTAWQAAIIPLNQDCLQILAAKLTT